VLFRKKKTEDKTAISADMIAHEGVVYFSAPFWEWFTGQNSILGIFFTRRGYCGLGSFCFLETRGRGDRSEPDLLHAPLLPKEKAAGF